MKLLFISLLLFGSLLPLIITPSSAYTTCGGVEAGDTIVIDYQLWLGEQSGTPYQSSTDSYPNGWSIDVKSQNFVEGFYNNLLGMKKGQEKTFTVKPSEGYTDPSHELFGETLIFRVYVQEIKSPIETCESGEGGLFSTIINVLGWIMGIGVAGFVGISLYLNLQKENTTRCLHCKEKDRKTLAEGTCKKCGNAYCRASFSKGCPNCRSNTFVPFKKEIIH